MRIYLAFISFFIVLQSVSAQTVNLKGKVLSNKTPVFGAVVSIDSLKKGCLTDTLGAFELKNIPSGKYKVKISGMGYETTFKIVQVTENEERNYIFYINESVSQHEQVVVTGTMREVSKQQSPIPVEVYSPEYFKKNPTPNLFESLQLVNGVQPQLNCNVCNTGDIHINGMEGAYTMVTIDGMPIVSSLSTVYGLSGIPNSIVQRVEVVKGPASTLYGSEAMGGLINIITKDPATAPKASVDIFTTSQKEINTDLSLRYSQGKVNSLLGISYFNFQNKLDINKDNFTDVTLQDRISIFNKWSLQRKNNRLASVALRYVYEDRWGGEMQWSSRFRGSDSIYGESIYTNRYELIGAYALPVEENILFQFSLNTHHQNSVYGDTYYIATQNIAFGQLLWSKKIGARHNLLVGAPVRYTFYDDNTPGTASADTVNTVNKPQHILLPGLFAQEEFQVNEKISTLAGIRYDYNSVHGSILSPRLSGKYNINKFNILRLSAGNGFRVVNLFTEDHAALTGSREVVIKNDLKPERSYNVNLNYQKFINTANGFIGLDGSVFYTYFTNKIIGDFSSDPDKIIYDNLKGYAVSKGITLNTDFTFGSRLKAIIGFTYMEVYSVQENEDGEMEKIPQMYAPKYSGTFAISYKLPGLNTIVDYTGRINGPMHLPVLENDFRPDQSPWFSIQNIQATTRVYKQFEIYYGVKNLFNFKPRDPLMRPHDPFDRHVNDPVNNPHGYTFDTSYNYAPLQGIRGFAGIRVVF
ncbi:MAG: TonB-dependent receptor [Cytophagaceae bacterium]